MIELGIFMMLNGLVMWAIGSAMMRFVNSPNHHNWTKRYHYAGDYWDGGELDDQIGTIGSDGRPEPGYTTYVVRDFAGGVERFDYGRG